MGREETLHVWRQDNGTDQTQQGDEACSQIIQHFDDPASLRFGKHRWTWNRLAEQVNSREIDDFIAASVKNGRQHEKAKALGLLVGDRWRHRKLLT